MCERSACQNWKGKKTKMQAQLSQLPLTAVQYSNQIQTCSTHCTWHEHSKSIRCTHVYACVCVHNIQKLKHTHCHSPPNLLLHTIPTLYPLWKPALQRQHTHSHTKNSRGPVQITGNCATNAPCAKSSNIYCTLIFKTLDVCGYSALCGKYQRLAISVFSHVQWGMKALKSTPN